MFGSSDDLPLLSSRCDVDDVGFTTFFMDNSNPTVISPVRHTFVYGRLNYDRNLLSRFIRPQNPAESNLASLARMLAKQFPRS